jgi:hypothetical protein
MRRRPIDPASRDFLKSRAWRIVRARHLVEHPDCAWCPASGPAGMTVDHIKPRSERPELALAPSNLQTLCATCHGSAKQSHERNAGNPLAGGTSSTGWPIDPRHPWNRGAAAAPLAAAAKSAPAAPAARPIGRHNPQNRPTGQKTGLAADREKTP